MPSRTGKMGKRKVSKGMIKRVEGGGVGLVNPMGWYDAERAEVSAAERSNSVATAALPSPTSPYDGSAKPELSQESSATIIDSPLDLTVDQ